ncbi:MAG: [cytidine(C)-cytidine(C)-adenosine (A)]-adding enzyme [Myxococcales bacterium]|jgi:tRNA nucleotidyltransferase (CCA-adding enzyme)|nr:[cytidine(C)-cytidine(C)-adenosine (A)]-adding enzyme [Myxococcales bacterium]
MTTSAPAQLLRFDFPPQLLTILRRLADAGFEAYVVGGSVRDILLGKAPQDFDIATSARAEAVMRLFRRVVPTGLKHGTVLVIQGELKAEVTTFRGEGDYLDGRHPESVVFLDDVEGDLARRDFTINAMAYDPVRQRFADPFDGRLDLTRHLVRCVGSALDRFSEDGLRVLRAVRFATTLGLDIEPETMAAIAPTLSTFDKVSRERQRDEFVKLLESAHPSRGIELLKESGILSRLLPELSESAIDDARLRLDRLLDAKSDASLELRLSALLADLAPAQLFGRVAQKTQATALLRRLRFSNAELDAVQKRLARREFALMEHATDAALRRAVSSVTPELVPDLLLLARALGADREREEALRTHIDAVLSTNPPLAIVDLAIDGDRVAAILGKGGPAIGLALNRLLDAVLDEPALNTPEALEAILCTGQEGAP